MSLRTIPVPFPIDLEKTLFPLCRGAGDPTMRIGLADAYLTHADSRRSGHAARPFDRLRHLGAGLGTGCRLGARVRPRSGRRPGRRLWVPAAAPPDRRALAAPQGRADHAHRRRDAVAHPRDPGAEGDRHGGATRLPLHGPGDERAGPGRPRVVPPAGPGTTRRDALLHVPPLGGRAAARRDRPGRVRSGVATGARNFTHAGSGERPAPRDPRRGTVDGGRGRAHGAR